MAQTTIHKGSYQSIPDSASPGLVYLKNTLPALDSLDAAASASALSASVAPGVTFTLNGAPPVGLQEVLAAHSTRSEKVARMAHDVLTAWDIVNDPSSGARTVIYESANITAFKPEPDNELPSHEVTIIELVPGDGGSLKATSLRTYLNAAQVAQKAIALFGTIV